jgi:hypothetical protein
LVSQDIGSGPSVATGAAFLETLAGGVGIAPLSISEQVKAGGEDVLE